MKTRWLDWKTKTRSRKKKQDFYCLQETQIHNRDNGSLGGKIWKSIYQANKNKIWATVVIEIWVTSNQSQLGRDEVYFILIKKTIYQEVVTV